MKITKFEADPDLQFSETGEGRHEGLHLSDIIKTLQFERDAKFNPDRPLDMMLLEQGHTWEEVLSHAIQRRWLNANPDYAGHRPDQIQLDGVWMSPDWFIPQDPLTEGRPVIEEWKATKTSQNRVLEDHQWYWVVQLQAYLKGMSAVLKTPMRWGRFRVWYINGDYSFDSKTSDLHLLRGYVRYDVEFTQREIDENWRRLIQQARRHGLLEQEPQRQKEDAWQKTPAATRRSSSKPPANSAPKPKGTTPRASRALLKPRSAS